MIVRELTEKNLNNLYSEILSNWDENPRDLELWWNLENDDLRIVNWEKNRPKPTEFPIVERMVMKYVKENEFNWGPPIHELEGKKPDSFGMIFLDNDYNIGLLKDWIRSRYSVIHIDDRSMRICPHCHRFINEDEGCYRLPKPDIDGLEYLCQDCYEDGGYILDVDGIAKPLETFIRYTDQYIYLIFPDPLNKMIRTYRIEKLNLTKQDVLVKKHKLQRLCSEKTGEIMEKIEEEIFPNITDWEKFQYYDVIRKWFFEGAKKIRNEYLKENKNEKI